MRQPGAGTTVASQGCGAVTHQCLPGSVEVPSPQDACLEYPRCAICDSDAPPRHLVVRKGYHVVKCRGCGLVYVSPRPRDVQSIDSLYTDRAYCDRQIRHVRSAGRMREAHWRLDHLERHAPRRGKLLDVGCSVGSFLLVARDRGWDVAGLDVSTGAIEYAASVHGLDARVGTLQETDHPDESFDVVTIFECIEHMRYPRAALKAANRVLKKGGLLVVTTPNIDGLFPRTTYALLAKTIGAWEHPTPPHHLYQFSRRTLAALLERSGFAEISTKTRPMGLRFTVSQMQSAIIDALKRRAGAQAPAVAEPSVARPVAMPPASATAPKFWRRASRASLAAICWSVSLPLYAIPVGRLGLGDSMLMVARKR